MTDRGKLVRGLAVVLHQINTAAVDPFTKSVIANSEDGNF